MNRLITSVILALGLLAVTGWGLYLHSCRSTGTTDSAAGRVHSSPLIAEASSPTVQAMEVYVRPHPPNFKVGRWVRFTRYDTLSDGQVKFHNGHAESIIVPSDSIDWPGVRKLP